MKRILIAIYFCTISFASCATSVDSTIKSLMIDRNNGLKAYIRLSDSPASAGCGVNSSWIYVLDVSDEVGRLIYSNLLTVYASGKRAKFIGTDVCGAVHAGIEELNRLELL